MLQVPGVEKYDTSSLRCLAITGGKVHEPVLQALKKQITPNIYRTYASTDSGQMAISKPADMDSKPLAAGMPVWCVDLRIVDNQSNPVAVSEIGEIICQSPLATMGYYMNPEATNASFRDGWFYTGDLGYFDEEGYLFVVGRKKDMVKSGGIRHLPIGDRRRALQASGRCRSRRDRRARPAMGRSGKGDCGFEKRVVSQW
jgi:acyl-coenzyme A synthetase/AMP-(fatty) acid ligase